MFRKFMLEQELNNLINECSDILDYKDINENAQCKAQKLILKNHKESLTSHKKQLSACPDDSPSCLEKHSDGMDAMKDSIKATKDKIKEKCFGKKVAKGIGNLLKKGLKKLIS